MSFFGHAAGARTEKSVLGTWWWTIDRWTLAGLLTLVLFGLILMPAASPSVAERIGLPPFYFVHHHIMMLVPTLLLMFGISMLSPKAIWRLASITMVVCLPLMVLVLFTGPEIKGATRWVNIFGFSLQPSEFAKPAFAVTSAWLIARAQQVRGFPGVQMSIGLYGMTIGLLLLQPDLGMSVVTSAIWGAQIFLSGISMWWIFVLAGLGALGLVGAYMIFPHVTYRIDRFLDPAAGDNYQVQKSLDAFSNGGWFGTGPGHGQVKLNLPDAHADFIFAVAGEELGLLVAVFIVLVFCFVLARSIYRASLSEEPFVVLGVGGLITQFALQSLVHMGSSLQLLPAKGMTLPFISYGGSSLLSLGLAMGMLLSLTRKRSPYSTAANWRSPAPAGG